MKGFEYILGKLSNFTERYNEISEKLSDINIINNQSLFKELSKELANIEPIVEAHKKFLTILKQIEDNQFLINNEKDPEIIEMATQELNDLDLSFEHLQQSIKLLLIPPVTDADKNIIVEIRAGTGGEEAALFAADLYRMYSHYVENKKWQLEVISVSESGLKGYKEIIFSITGKNVYDNLRFESGAHRVQRIPATESGGRIHTSAVTVAVLPEPEETDVVIRQEDLRIDVYRAGGAGGQHVNKTSSAVRITHIPTGFVVQCQDSRSQLMNKASALKVLRSRLYEYEKGLKDKERADIRKEQVGTGDRSQKIRTYNYPQNRVTDHRINLTLYKLDIFMGGEMDEIIEGLKLNDIETRMEDM